jgi:thymidine phosphorylase
MTTTLELINAISSGNAVEIEDAFNSAMAEKVASKLDDMRVNIAHAMFNAQAPEANTELETTNEE